MSRKRIPPFVMKGGKVTPARVKVSADAAYTVDELKDQARHWLNSLDERAGVDRFKTELVFSLFLTWLRKQEDTK